MSTRAEHEDYKEQLSVLIDEGRRLLVPIAAILETGNHIAKAKGEKIAGKHREAAARRLVALVEKSQQSRPPWTTMGSVDIDALATICVGFPLDAAAKLGLADRSIIFEAKRMKQKTPHLTVSIWTLDNALAARSPDPL